MAIDWASVSPWTIPQWSQLAQQAQAAIPTSVPNMTANVGAGMSSPLLQQILGPMLQRLQQPQQLQQQNLTDAFRSAGGLSSSAYGGAFDQLLQQQGLQTNDAMASIMQSVLSPLLQAFNQNTQNQFLPANAMTNILNAGKPTVIGSQMNPQNNPAINPALNDPGNLLASFTGGSSYGGGGQGGTGGGGSAGAGGYNPFDFNSVAAQSYNQLFGYQPTNVGYGSTNPGAMYDQYGNPLGGSNLGLDPSMTSGLGDYAGGWY